MVTGRSKERNFLRSAVFLLVLASVVTAVAAARPKYVFLFIGDGMSAPQRAVAEEFSVKTGNGGLAMNRMPYKASLSSRSASSLVTDSAAAGTAIACGEKTRNGMLGVRPDGTRLESVAEVAKKSGMKVGIITTVTIVNATPAAFFAHRAKRGQTYQIGLDLIASGFDYFAGGGAGFSRNNRKDPEYRGDLFDLARGAGYIVTTNRAEWLALKPGTKSWNAFKVNALSYTIDAAAMGGDQPTLAEMVTRGTELLDNDKGFFIMCEGGKIDHSGHGNDAATNLRDVIALDDAVKAALEFMKRHPEETLVIVTGDHETGGMSLGFAGTGGRFRIELLAKQKGSADKFSDKVKRMLRKDIEMDFVKVQPLVTEWFGLEFGRNGDAAMRVTDHELERLKAAFEHDREYIRNNIKDTTAYNARRRYRFAGTVKAVLSAHAGVGWSTGSHTALPVLTTAQGAGAEIVSGMKDNTDIAIRLKALITGR